MPRALSDYLRAAERAANAVITTYSTSFGAATKLLGNSHRQHVRNIYALVRIADELVDGVCAEAQIPIDAQRDYLAAYEAETYRAIATGYSSNVIIHAFAHTARECSIERAIIEPFFNSMRADIAEQVNATALEHAEYVYGSAEVVGLMCLRVFTRNGTYTEDERATLEHGAKQLGAAFQNVNFLRDLADDTERLQRDYLSGHGEPDENGDAHKSTHQQSIDGRLTDADRDEWVNTIRQQLRDAEATLPLLPKDARRAVRSALHLFAELNERILRTPAATLYRKRVRVSDPKKLVLIAGAVTNRECGEHCTDATSATCKCECGGTQHGIAWRIK